MPLPTPAELQQQKARLRKVDVQAIEQKKTDNNVWARIVEWVNDVFHFNPAPKSVQELRTQFVAPAPQAAPKTAVQTGAKRSVTSLQVEFEGKTHPYSQVGGNKAGAAAAYQPPIADPRKPPAKPDTSKDERIAVGLGMAFVIEELKEKQEKLAQIKADQELALKLQAQENQAGKQLQSDLDYALALELEAEEQEAQYSVENQIETDGQLAEKLQTEEMAGCLEEALQPLVTKAANEEPLAPPAVKSTPPALALVAAQRPQPIEKMAPEHQLALLFIQASLKLYAVQVISVFTVGIIHLLHRAAIMQSVVSTNVAPRSSFLGSVPANSPRVEDVSDKRKIELIKGDNPEHQPQSIACR